MKEIKENELFTLQTDERPYLFCIKYNKSNKEYKLERIPSVVEGKKE